MRERPRLHFALHVDIGRKVTGVDICVPEVEGGETCRRIEGVGKALVLAIIYVGVGEAVGDTPVLLEVIGPVIANELSLLSVGISDGDSGVGDISGDRYGRRSVAERGNAVGYVREKLCSDTRRRG